MGPLAPFVAMDETPPTTKTAAATTTTATAATTMLPECMPWVYENAP